MTVRSVIDEVIEDVVRDLGLKDESLTVENLLLEDGFDVLLEDGVSFILLE